MSLSGELIHSFHESPKQRQGVLKQQTKIMTRKAAIVLGLNVNALSVVRSVGRSGVDVFAVYAGGSVADKVGIRSRYLREAIRLPNGYADEDLLDALHRLGRASAARDIIIIPTSDAFALFLSTHKRALSERFIPAVPDFEILKKFLDKSESYQICIDNDVKAPETFSPRNKQELSEILPSIHYPSIVKPTQTFENPFPGTKGMLCYGENELVSAFSETPSLFGKVVIQKIVKSGDGRIIMCNAFCDRDGRVRGLFTGRKLRQWPMNFGQTSFGVSEDIPELKVITRNLLENIKYEGFAGLEFAEDQDTKEYYFIELNTRTSYPNQWYIDSGVDLVRRALESYGFFPKSGSSLTVQKDCVHWIDFNRDLMRQLRFGEGNSFPWLRSLFKTRSFAHWDPRDPVPFFYGLVDLVQSFTLFLWRRVRGDRS